MFTGCFQPCLPFAFPLDENSQDLMELFQMIDSGDGHLVAVRFLFGGYYSPYAPCMVYLPTFALKITQM
jgi:hypothetical protein